MCESCEKTIKWNYNQQNTFDRLGKLSKDVELYCPNPECGANIELDWENCAICGLDIQEMLLSEPKLDDF
jgi:hypothetical protein